MHFKVDGTHILIFNKNTFSFARSNKNNCSWRWFWVANLKFFSTSEFRFENLQFANFSKASECWKHKGNHDEKFSEVGWLTLIYNFQQKFLFCVYVESQSRNSNPRAFLRALTNEVPEHEIHFCSVNNPTLAFKISKRKWRSCACFIF